MTAQKISWIQAVFLSTLSFVPSFFVFFLLEVIWGDVLKNAFDYENYQDVYFNLNLILIIGLLFAFSVSLLVNLLVFRTYAYKSKLIANLFALIVTLILLFFASWLLVIIAWPEFYSSLSLIEKIQVSAYFFMFVAIYLLPSPVWFWIISLIAYHVVLVFFIKYFFVLKNTRRKLKPKKETKSKKKVNYDKYKIM